MSLDEKVFRTVKTLRFPSAAEALKAVNEYARFVGCINVKVVDERDGDGVRYTAKTPGGRNGRNIAFGDYDLDFGEVV